jgi:transposase
MIPVAASVRIWIATGHTDMRKGMQGLALLVQEGLGRDPFAGDVFVFRGRSPTSNTAWPSRPSALRNKCLSLAQKRSGKPIAAKARPKGKNVVDRCMP